MKTNRKVSISLTIALAAILVLTSAAFGQSATASPAIQSLASLIPTPQIPEAFMFSIDYLPGHRIFVVSDRIQIIDLTSMKVVEETEFPESIQGDWDKYTLFHRVEPLEKGVAWLVQKVPWGNSDLPNDIVPDCFYFQFDDELNLVREFKLNDVLQPAAISIYLVNPTRDGSELVYLSYEPDETDISLLKGKIPLDPKSDKVLYKTEMGNREKFSWLSNTNLINNGETIFFVGGGSNLEPLSTPTKYVYAAIGSDGNGLKILDPNTLADPYEFYQISDSHGQIPQTSPIALLIPEDPFPVLPENPDDYVFTVPPLKSAYAWNVETGAVTEIPFQVPMEDGNAVLSESGSFLATATADDPLTEINSFTVRLYNTATGEMILSQQVADLIKGRIIKLGVSEAEKAVKITYFNDGEIFFSELPFAP